MSLLASQSKIIIAGGSGFLGQLLSKSLIDHGHEVVVLSRNQNSSLICSRSVFWDAKQIDIWVEELNGADVLINLTGKSIDCRHTKKNREEISAREVLLRHPGKRSRGYFWVSLSFSGPSPTIIPAVALPCSII